LPFKCNLQRYNAEAYETSAQTEKRVMHLVANVSLFDIACQFTTAEAGLYKWLYKWLYKLNSVYPSIA
jgi:hypothetical protein